MSANLSSVSDRTLIENYLVATALCPDSPSTFDMECELFSRHMSTDPGVLRGQLYGVGHTWRKGTLKRHALKRIRSTYIVTEPMA